ncbi:MAG: DUF4234 domain-containing protein [Lachnospiraceae bacterium]|nr:DUF4234 domain-containing protein [Lachnospiraceae bacterium]
MNCPNCGANVDEGTKFCPNCGSDISNVTSGAGAGAGESNQNNTTDNSSYEQPEYQQTYETYTGGSGTARNIVVCIILSIVTCGIYSLYWIYCLNEDINSLSGNENATGGGMVILFSIITCGIYSLYWCYKMGERVDTIKNQPGASTPILFLVLSIFGLEIVNFCLMQDAINKAVGA